MKNTIKALVLASAISALAGVGAYASEAVSGAITLNATVQTDDAVDCSATGTVNFGNALVQGGNSNGQLISCNVTDNDSAGVDMYVYGTVALTGTTSSSNTIALTNISFSPTDSGYTAFSDVSVPTGVTGAIGGKVYSGLAEGLNATAENFYLKLAIPANQAADAYSTTVVVGIVPAAS
jgi:hypothetical protein